MTDEQELYPDDAADFHEAAQQEDRPTDPLVALRQRLAFDVGFAGDGEGSNATRAYAEYQRQLDACDALVAELASLRAQRDAALKVVLPWPELAEMRAALGVQPEPGGSGMSGAELIAAERQRQISAEGWTAQHDAEHVGEALAAAACCYALPPAMRRFKQVPKEFRSSGRWESLTTAVPTLWPWDGMAWKPTPDDRVRELVKAGALIAAEIDRFAAGVQPEGSENE